MKQLIDAYNYQASYRQQEQQPRVLQTGCGGPLHRVVERRADDADYAAHGDGNDQPPGKGGPLTANINLEPGPEFQNFYEQIR